MAKKRLMAFCERCWLVDHIKWEPESIDGNGTVIMSLSCVDTPEAINLGNVDICCMCRGITVVGIYQMIDPEEIYFKQFKKADNLFAYDLGFSEEEQWGEEDER